MTAQWVIPRWPETYEHLAGRLQKPVHAAQDIRRISEVLERVHGNDNVRKLLR
jgi:hypothetical protein